MSSTMNYHSVRTMLDEYICCIETLDSMRMEDVREVRSRSALDENSSDTTNPIVGPWLTTEHKSTETSKVPSRLPMMMTLGANIAYHRH